MRVLIVPDKFKGTLTASEAAEAIAAGWRDARPKDELELLPMSDGGDGFGEIVGELLGAEARKTLTLNAAHEPIEAGWWWSEKNQIAILESASAIGLAMLPRGKFHPFELDTAGLGIVLQEVSRLQPGANLIVGIGGSATNDGGFGMALKLGFRFLDANGAEISRWIDLENLERIEPPRQRMQFNSLTIATDVQNPLLGPHGATRIYGPQKGLRPEDFPLAERCLARLADRVRPSLNVEAESEPGTGAAGGLGYGLRVFLRGRFEAGFEIFARLACLSERMRRVDLVLTGEGAIDASTLMGKGTGAVAQLAKEQGRRCIGLAGMASERGDLFSSVHGIHPLVGTLEESMSRPADGLRKLSFGVATGVEDVRAAAVTSE